MELWNLFIGFIVQSIEFITHEVGVSEAIAIIGFTLIGRLILMPVNLFAMAHMYRNKKVMAAIKPELGLSCDYIKEGYSKYPQSSHVIYYKQRKVDQILIVRILHKSMDVNSAL